MLMDFAIIFLCFLLAWASLHLLAFTTSKLPPGPFQLPIFGNLFKLGNKPHESLAKLSKIYGPLMSLKLGSLTTIVMSSPSMAKEILQNRDICFANRPIPDVVRIHKHHESSLLWLPYSPQWRSLRKKWVSNMFTAQKLNENEEIRLMKVKELLDHIREISMSRGTVNINQVIFSTILNILSNTMFSVDLADFKSETQEFKASVRGVVEGIGKPNISDYFPLLRPLDLQGVRKHTAKCYERLDKVFHEIIDRRLQEQCAPNDSYNAILFHKDESGFKLQPHDIKSILRDVFIAGTDTVAGTLEWAMTELLHDRERLRKARLELKEEIGEGNRIYESDIARLPYLQAIVKETLRLHPSAPLLAPHRAELDTEICGFKVPKNAQVLVNVWAIGRDPNSWVNPTLFTPERFLGSDVDFKGRDFELIPFGSGRMICPGHPLAYRMVHLILASLLRSFDWELEDGMTPECKKSRDPSRPYYNGLEGITNFIKNTHYVAHITNSGQNRKLLF